jgi:hypothetical protein
LIRSLNNESAVDAVTGIEAFLKQNLIALHDAQLMRTRGDSQSGLAFQKVANGTHVQAIDEDTGSVALQLWNPERNLGA